jgi:hypothetical protein
MSTAPPGSYLKTSRGVTFEQDASGGGALSAECQKMDGSWIHSALHYDLANMNGVLTPEPSGSYQQTSRNIRLENGEGGVYLVAECRKINGSWVSSKLKIEDIANIDGVLKYGR